jgi:hypothetical protein
MRIMGHNVLAILAAAIAIYAIEFVIFGLLIPGEQYAAMVGLSMDQMHADRMPVGVLMPILSAIGLSLVIKWRNAAGLMGGMVTALIMAIVFALPATLYGYVYGSHTETFVFVNLMHFLVCWGVAGAILGAWK